jgi:hypothetical protein
MENDDLIAILEGVENVEQFIAISDEDSDLSDFEVSYSNYLLTERAKVSKSSWGRNTLFVCMYVCKYVCM